MAEDDVQLLLNRLAQQENTLAELGGRFSTEAPARVAHVYRYALHVSDTLLTCAELLKGADPFFGLLSPHHDDWFMAHSRLRLNARALQRLAEETRSQVDGAAALFATDRRGFNEIEGRFWSRGFVSTLLAYLDQAIESLRALIMALSPELTFRPGADAPPRYALEALAEAQAFLGALCQRNLVPGGAPELNALEAKALCQRLETIQKIILVAAQHWMTAGCPELYMLATPQASRQSLRELWNMEWCLQRLESSPAATLGADAELVRHWLAAYLLALSRATCRMISQVDPALALRLLRENDVPRPALRCLREGQPKLAEVARRPERGPWASEDSAFLGVALSVVARAAWMLVREVKPEIQLHDPPLAPDGEFTTYFAQAAVARQPLRMDVPAVNSLDQQVGLAVALILYTGKTCPLPIMEQGNWRLMCQSLRAVRECLFCLWDNTIISGSLCGEPAVPSATDIIKVSRGRSSRLLKPD